MSSEEHADRNGSSQTDGADPEVIPGPRYRTFSREYKLRVLEEADQCERGEIAALLKREGIYYATLSKWRQQQAAGRLEEPEGRERKEDTQAQAKIARLEREKARLEVKLAKAEAIIEVQKKLSEILGLDSD
jgi:transposase-like protein